MPKRHKPAPTTKPLEARSVSGSSRANGCFTGSVPAIRVRSVNGAPLNVNGAYVLYWMIASRRTLDNFALQAAVDMAVHLQKPLVVFEALRVGYAWASDRLHTFVIQGMRDNQAAFAKTAVTYVPYVERRRGEAKGLLQRFSRAACAVFTDDLPGFFQPRMVESVGAQLRVPLMAVDSAGLLPLAATERVFERAFSFRRFLQQNLAEHILAMPRFDPLHGQRFPKLERLEPDIEQRWPVGRIPELSEVRDLPISHAVECSSIEGGTRAARRRLDAFITHDLCRYGEGRNHPDDESSSGLSAYLHFGHISSHTALRAIARNCDWTPDRISGEVTGSADRGWWGLPSYAETFLDELVTWRELGLNTARYRHDFDRYETLPAWSRETLALHEHDPRPQIYTLDQLEWSQTSDEIWNAAQTQLRREGRMHNYLRMLWGKKVLAWSPTPQEALERLIHLNNRYALDGRDANSVSGIFWVFGRYDRAWGPERKVFGKVRYMTSDSTRKKLRLKQYLCRYGTEQRIGA